MAKKKVDWFNCTISSNKTYDPELIRKMYNPETSVVNWLERKWKKSK